MHRFRMSVVGIVVVAVVGSVAGAREKRLNKSEVPAAVLDAVAARYPKAKMTLFSEEQEQGKTVYEVALEEEGRKTEVTARADGVLLAEERVIAIKELPAAVRDGLAASAFARAEVRVVEMVTELATPPIVTCELHVATAGAVHELVFDVTGKLIKDEKQTTKE